MTTPRERPILFSAPMVRALLAGTKTQTRRVVRFEYASEVAAWFNETADVWRMGVEGPGGVLADYGSLRCPYGAPGDRLWVRETFIYRHKHDRFYYRADHPTFDPYAHNGWKPSIYMPRRASRITLEVTGVRVERLQAISETDAMAEGIACTNEHRWGLAATGREHNAPTHAFRALWESINGAELWAANPWVWVVEFKRVTP